MQIYKINKYIGCYQMWDEHSDIHTFQIYVRVLQKKILIEFAFIFYRDMVFINLKSSPIPQPHGYMYLKTIKRNFQETSPVDAATFWISAETLKNRRRQSESELHTSF